MQATVCMLVVASVRSIIVCMLVTTEVWYWKAEGGESGLVG